MPIPQASIIFASRLSLPLAVALCLAGCTVEPSPQDLAYDGIDSADDDGASEGGTDEPEGFGGNHAVDGLVSDFDPAQSCVDCYPYYTFECNAGGWPFACPPWTWTLAPSGPNCATCVEYVCGVVPAVGQVGASPEQVSVAGATACTTIDWSSCTDSQVYVSHNGAPETLFAQGTSGTQAACWIQPNNSYEFCLYEGTGHTNQLDCVTVQGVPADPPGDPCSSCPSGQSCHCEPGVCYPNNLACQ